MRTGLTGQMFILCGTVLIALALVIYAPYLTGASGKAMLLLAFALVIGAIVAAWSLHHTARKKSRAELPSGEQYRQLAEEYRRLADLAITAREHTDLKLGELSAQLDHVREQNESLQRILKEVE